MQSDARPAPAARLLIALLDVYRRWISPFFLPHCRFHPTCSAYAVEAIRVHGAVRGPALAVIRLLKCAPWHPGGLDPVPPRHPRSADPTDGDDPRDADLDRPPVACGPQDPDHRAAGGAGARTSEEQASC